MLPADLSDPDGGRTELVARTEAALGPLDILVNNAAMGGYAPFEEVRPEHLERCLQVNLWAPWELMKAVVPGMRERGRGWILNLTSFTRRAAARPAVPDQQAGEGGVRRTARPRRRSTASPWPRPASAKARACP